MARAHGAAALGASVAALAALALAAAAALGATVERLPLEEVVARAQIAWHARVARTACGVDADGLIFTDVEIEAIEVLAGDPLARRETVRVLGGTVGDRTLWVPGMPRLREGEEAVLFLTPLGDGGYRVPVGLGQGVWRVTRDPSTGAASACPDLRGLALVDPVTGRVEPLPAAARAVPLEDLLARVRAIALEMRRKR